MRMFRPIVFVAAPALLSLIGCAGHGKHTSELRDDATLKMELLRSATQYDQAKQQFQSGEFESALETATISVSLNDRAPQTRLLQGRILLELGRIEAALEALDSGLELGPSKWDGEIHFYRGVALERRGKLDEAMMSYRAAVEAAPDDERFHLATAEALIDLGRLDEAEQALIGQDGQFDTHAGFRQALGFVAMLRNDDEAAITYFREAGILSPDDPVLVEDLAMAQVTAKRFGDAEDSLARLNKRGKLDDRPDLKVLWASCLLELNRPVEARAILVPLAFGSGEDDPEVWVRLIDVALVLDDEWMLRTAADQMIIAAPDRHEGYVAKAIWKRRLGDLAGALEAVDRAIDRAGDSPTPGRLRAILERQQLGTTAG